MIINQLRPSILTLALLLVVALGCKKADDTPIPAAPITPTNNDYGTPMQNVPTVDNMVMYEVNLRALSPLANLQGVISRLDSIKALGVNVIWLMPIMRQGQLRSVGSPYAIQNYKEVSPEYGTLADLRSLTDKAHQKGMAVILDWVANHTSWDNPWIATTAWYTKDGSGNVISPIVPGQTWNDVADLNFDNQDMRKAMIAAMKHWISEANVDGFRCDAADLVPYAFWKQANDSLKRLTNRKIIMLAEGARADHFTAGFQLNFAWDHFARLKDVFRTGALPSVLNSTHETEMRALNPSQRRLRFTSNHDESAWDATPINLFGGNNGSMAAFTIAAFSGGVPLIYSSQEVGRAATVPFFSNTTINWSANRPMLLQYRNLMQIYQSGPAWRSSRTTFIGDNNNWAVEKVSGQDTVLIVANVRNAASTIVWPLTYTNRAWTNAVTGQPVTLANPATMAPYGTLLLRRR